MVRGNTVDFRCSRTAPITVFLCLGLSWGPIRMMAGCISTRISHSQKLSKYRVVLNAVVRSLSRGGKTSPCLRTRNSACLAELGTHNSWFAVTGIKTAPTGGGVIIISLQRLERAWRSSVHLAPRGARSFRTGHVMLGYDTAYAHVARRHPAARTALLHSSCSSRD